MGLSTVAVTAMLFVGLMAASGVMINSLSFNLDRAISGFQNFNEINNRLQNTQIEIEEMDVSSIEGTLNIKAFNNGTTTIDKIYVMVDGTIVEHNADKEIFFPYEKANISIPLEKIHLMRGSRIKVISDGAFSYSVFE